MYGHVNRAPPHTRGARWWDTQGGGQRRATVALVLGECDAAQQAYVRALRTLVDVVSGHHQCDGSTHSAHGGRGVRQRGAGRTVRVEGTKDAQFCLIVEQPTSPEPFMSERLSLALAAGCVPVYHGPGQVRLKLTREYGQSGPLEPLAPFACELGTTLR